MQVGVDFGMRDEATDRVGLMLQLLYRFRDRDKGAQAEPSDTGSHVIAIAPGVSYALPDKLQLYAFVQLPLYQRVNGVQITSDWSAVGGVSVQF